MRLIPLQSRVGARPAVPELPNEESVPAERDLLRRARDLNRGALSEVYDRYSPALYRYALRLLSDPATAEECVAETFSRFLHALHSGSGPKDHLQAYLYRVAHNWITDYYRSDPTVGLPDNAAMPSGSEPAHVVAQKAEQDRVRRALAGLPSDERLAISLKYVEGWHDKDIARALDLQVAGVRSLQRRGLATLQKLLGGQNE